MISWTFTVAVLALAFLPVRLPAGVRVVAVALLSALAAAQLWSVPVLAILAAAAAVWGIGAALPRLPERPRQAVLVAAIASVVGALAWLRAGSPARTTLVPLTAITGLSYFSLKFIQHLLDANAGRAARVGFPAFLATIFFLPTYAAGPIERTSELAAKLEATPLPWSERILGLERILFGLAKKLLVGDRLLAWAEPAFARPDLQSPAGLWLALYAFAFAIYLDFAGYSDIAIGAGRLAGISVRENFDSPYTKPDLGRLWQSWHMSLTSWLRDFVFVPVARRTLRWSRRPLASQAVAHGVTMLLCGLWHGLAWNFAAWGLYHAVLLSGLALVRERSRVALRRSGPTEAGGTGTSAVPELRSPSASPGELPRARAPQATWPSRLPGRLRHGAAVLATFHAFALGLVLFGCPLDVALQFVARMLLLDRLW